MGFIVQQKTKKPHQSAFANLQTYMSKSDDVLFSARSKLSIHCTTMTLFIWMTGRKSLWHATVAHRQQCSARSRYSLRQSVTLPAQGLFGKPCWIAHFVCGIRAGQSCFICWYLNYQPANALTKHSGVVPQWVCMYKRQNKIKKRMRCFEHKRIFLQCSTTHWIQL